MKSEVIIYSCKHYNNDMFNMFEVLNTEKDYKYLFDRCPQPFMREIYKISFRGKMTKWMQRLLKWAEECNRYTYSPIKLDIDAE